MPEKVNRIRHNSRNIIEQGTVGDIRNKLEQFRYLEREGHVCKLRCRSNSFDKSDNLSEGDCSEALYSIDQNTTVNVSVQRRLFTSNATPDREISTQTVSNSNLNPNSNRSQVIAWETNNTLLVLLETGEKTVKDKHLIPSGDNSAEIDYITKHDLNLTEHTNVSAQSELAQSINSQHSGLVTQIDLDVETKVFLNINRQTEDMEPKNQEDKTKPILQVPKNVTMADIYTMIAQFKEEMSGVPTTLTELGRKVNDLTNKVANIEKQQGTDATAMKNLEQKISLLEAADTTSADQITEVSDRLQNAETKIERLLQTISLQSMQIKELSSKNASLSAKVFNTNSCMTISGLLYKEGEDCKALVDRFFVKVMKIEQKVEVARAFRIGSKMKIMMIYLARPVIKGLIFKHVKNLKDMKKSQGEYFTIREYLTGAENETSRRANDVIYENKYLPATDRLQLKMDRGKLYIEDAVYTPYLKSPEGTEILKWNPDRWLRAKSKSDEVIKNGEEITIDGSKIPRLYSGSTGPGPDSGTV